MHISAQASSSKTVDAHPLQTYIGNPLLKIVYLNSALLPLMLFLSACSTGNLNDSKDGRTVGTQRPSSSIIEQSRPTAPPAVTVQSVSQSVTAQPVKVSSSDVWSRVGKSLTWGAEDSERIRHFVKWYRERPAFLYQVSERASPYLFHIVTTLESRGLPIELALLPIVESGYDPMAYSSGRAVGLWQFIEGTGKEFGLEQTWWYDGRRDIVSSTRAAARYLEQLNLDFNGDWYLTLAAYNSGPGRVRRAIEANDKHNKPVDYWSLPLPRETRDYVPKLIALARIFANPDSYGIKLADIPDTLAMVTVNTGGQLDIATAADLAGVTLEDLHSLNPGLARWATPPDGPHVLHVPANSALQFQAQLQRLEPSDRVTWDEYHIKRGDTLSAIAQGHRTSVSVIREVNKLDSNLIRAGKTLLIPRPSAQSRRFTQQLAEQTFRRPQAGKGQRTNYAVRAGDSLWSIARSYGTSTRKLARWNGLKAGGIIHPGQILALYVSNTAPANGQ